MGPARSWPCPPALCPIQAIKVKEVFKGVRDLVVQTNRTKVEAEEALDEAKTLQSNAKKQRKSDELKADIRKGTAKIDYESGMVTLHTGEMVTLEKVGDEVK